MWLLVSAGAGTCVRAMAGAGSLVDACQDSGMIGADTVRDWAALDRLERRAGRRGGSGVAGDARAFDVGSSVGMSGATPSAIDFYVTHHGPLE